MSVNLLKMVQQNLFYPELQKIDPNTQVMVVDECANREDKFSQAAIPAVLTGLFKYSQSDEGATALLQNDNSNGWMNKIFDDNKTEVIQAISTYCMQTNESTVVKMNAIATETVKLVTENLPADATIKDVKTFFSDQKSNILLYLPAELNIGRLLHDNTLDDETNKMEGPVSSLIRNIGEAFSTPVTGEQNHESKITTVKKEEQIF